MSLDIVIFTILVYVYVHVSDKKMLKIKLGSLKEACKPRSLFIRAKNCDVHLYAVTFWACLSFIGLGAALLVFGPTLLDFAEHLGVGIDVLVIMFTCRAIGGAVGSVVTGIVMDKLEQYSFTILCVIYVCCIATTVAIPFSVHIAMLGVIMALNGVAMGSIDNGTHAVLIKLWRDKAGPCMQVLHFCFAFGAFIAPLVAKTFVTEQSEDLLAVNATDYNVSFSCEDTLNGTLSSDKNIDLLILDEIKVDDISSCMDKIHSTCQNLTASSVITVSNNCTLIYGDDGFTSNFAWAYWIASTLFVPSLIAFIYFAISKEFSKKCSKRNEVEISEEDEEAKKNKSNTSSKQAAWFLIIMFTLLFIFMFLYVGLEVAYGSLIFTVAVKGELGFSKSDAAVLTALFWGTFAFARLFSVLLAVLKVRSSVMIACNLSGSFLASLILVFYPHDPIAVWIGSGVLGASYASIYPTTMTWMSENTEASGKATSVLVAAGTLGDISIPSIVGVVIAKVSKDSLLYITFGGILISVLVVAVLFLVTCLYNRSRRKGVTTNTVVKYEKLNEETKDCNLSENCNDSNVDVDSSTAEQTLISASEN